MQILQGRYLKSIKSAKGTLKAVQLKTVKGKQVVKIPKVLRAIAKEEITLGDDVRIWVSAAEDKQKGRKSLKEKRFTAIQIVPLSPRTKIAASALGKRTTSQKAKADKKLTVQLCQKKNCCKKGGDALWIAFEQSAKDARRDSKKQPFKLEAVGCLGGCKNGPNIRLLPANVKYRGVRPSDISQLISPNP